MAIRFIEFLRTSKHFCLIRSDIEFRLVCNPYGDDLLKGTDICTLPAGAFVFDLWKLLPEEYFKNNPVFKLGLAYDDTLLVNGKKVSVDYSDVDYGSGIAGLVGSTESSLASIVTQLVALALAVSTINDKIGAVNTPNTVLRFLSQIQMYSDSMHEVLGYFETHSIIDDTSSIKDTLQEILSLVSLLQSQIESDLHSVELGVSAIKSDVATVKTDVSSIKQNTGYIETDLGLIYGRLEHIEYGVKNFYFDSRFNVFNWNVFKKYAVVIGSTGKYSFMAYDINIRDSGGLVYKCDYLSSYADGVAHEIYLKGFCDVPLSNTLGSLSYFVLPFEVIYNWSNQSILVKINGTSVNVDWVTFVIKYVSNGF